MIVKYFISVLLIFSCGFFIPSFAELSEDGISEKSKWQNDQDSYDASHQYSFFMLLTNNLVLNLDASNIDGIGAFATGSSNALNWIDLSEGLNNGFLNNFGMTSLSGWDGVNTVNNPSALKFDGVDDNVALNSAPNIGSQLSFAYSLWVKINTVEGGSIASFTGDYVLDRTVDSPGIISLKEVTGNQFGFQLRYDDGSGRGGPVGGKIIPGKWQNLVLVRDYNNAFNLYVDGVLAGTTKDNGKSLTPPIPKLGRHATSSNSVLNGQIASLRIYKNLLTQDQITENYLAEAYRFQGIDNISPGFGSYSMLEYKKSGDTFDVYVEDVNPALSGDNNVLSIDSITCQLGLQKLVGIANTEQIYKSGLTFDGIDDAVVVSDSSSLKPKEEVAVEAFVRPLTNTGNQVIVQKGETGIGESYLLDIDATKWRFGFRDSNLNLFSVNSTSDVVPNKWVYIAGTYDGSNLKLYVNGVQEASAKIDLQMLSQSTIGLGIGNSPELFSGLAFGGQIAQARIYNRTLSQDEIKRNNRYRFESSNPQGLIGLWKFDDSSLNNSSFVVAKGMKWDDSLQGLISDVSLNGSLINFNFNNVSGWLNQYFYNIGKQTFLIPSLDGNSQIEKLFCTASDQSGNSTSINEEIAGAYLIKSGPKVNTNLTNNQSLNLNDKFTITITDEVPNKNTLLNPVTPSASIDGNAFLETCKILPISFSKAFLFDGIDDYIDIMSSGDLSFGNNDFTLLGWIKPRFLKRSWLYSDLGNSLKSNVGLGLSENMVHCICKDEEGGFLEVSSNTVLQADRWYYVSLVKRGNFLKMYVDGALENVALNPQLGNIDLSGGLSPNIGRHQLSGEYFSGQIEDFQIYKRALSLSEISSLYKNPGIVINPFNLIAWWRFNDGDGVLHDYSGTGNVGIVKGYGSVFEGSIINSNLTNSIDGISGSCDVTVTDTNPSGPSIQKNKNLTVSIIDNNSITSLETKGVSIIRNVKPLSPQVLSAFINGINTDNKSGTYDLRVGHTLNLTFNSSDLDFQDVVTLSTLTIPSVGVFGGIKVLNQGTATYTFTPSSSHIGMTYSFTVRAIDGYGAVATKDLPISITVAPNTPPSNPVVVQASVNNNPVGIGGTYIVSVGEKLVIDISANDADPYSTVSLLTPISTKQGVLIQESSPSSVRGIYSYIPALNDEGKIFNFTVKAIDNNNTQSSSNLSIIVVVSSGNSVAVPIQPIVNTQQPISDSTQSPNLPSLAPNVQSPIPNVQSPIPNAQSPILNPPFFIDPKNLPVIKNVEFPQIPSFLTNPSTTILTIESLKSSANLKGANLTKQSNVILTDSPIAFALSINSDFAKTLLNVLPNGISTKARIIDSVGKEFNISADVYLSPTRNKPLIIYTPPVPINVSEGPGELVLLIGNEPKAKIPVVVYKAQFISSEEKGIINLRPIINSIVLHRNKNIVKIILGGENFFNKKIFINGQQITTKNKQISVSVLPKEGLRLRKIKILKGEQVMILKYKLTTLKKSVGKVVLSLINPYGQAITPLEIPVE